MHFKSLILFTHFSERKVTLTAYIAVTPHIKQLRNAYCRVSCLPLCPHTQTEQHWGSMWRWGAAGHRGSEAINITLQSAFHCKNYISIQNLGVFWTFRRREWINFPRQSMSWDIYLSNLMFISYIVVSSPTLENEYYNNDDYHEILQCYLPQKSPTMHQASSIRFEPKHTILH